MYNSDDCIALEKLTQSILLLSTCGIPGIRDCKTPAVRVDRMTPAKRTKWQVFRSTIPGFEQINRAAHWDYQRDRVYIRSHPLLKRSRQYDSRSQKRPPASDKVRVVFSPTACPSCGSLLIPRAVRKHSLFDLIWGRNALKLRLVSHEFCTGWCGACQREFRNEGPFPVRGKYGWNLAAYLLYHSIQLRIHLASLSTSVQRLWGVKIAPATLIEMKSRAACFFQETVSQIIDRLVRGPLVHVDETAIQVLKHEAPVLYGSFSPDGARIVTASSNHSAQVWDWATGRKLLPALKHGLSTYVVFAAYSPDGKRIVTTGSDRTARLWDATTGQPVAPPLDQSGIVLGAAFRADSRALATWNVGNNICVWNAETGDRLLPALTHKGYIWNVEFSPDGSLLASASMDQTARLWDAETGEAVSVPLHHGGPVLRAAFHPHDPQLLTASGEGAARIWRIGSLNWPLEDIMEVIDLLAAHEPAGGIDLSRLTARRIVAAFQSIRAKHPDYLVTTAERRLAWHRSEAAHAELMKRWSSAVWHLGALIESSSTDGRLYVRIAYASMALARWNDAYRNFHRAAELGSCDLRGLIYSAMKLSDLATAREIAGRLVQQALDDEAQRAAATLDTGIAPGLLDDYTTTIGFAEEAVREAPSSIRAAGNLAMQLVRAGRSGEAVRVLQSPVIEPWLQPRAQRGPDELLLYRAAIAFSVAGATEKARELLPKAIEQENSAMRSLNWNWYERSALELLRKEAEALLSKQSSKASTTFDK